jgi:glyoxylase-like metal-dependent hydrolase (beta-lactamase superfamily II)
LRALALHPDVLLVSSALLQANCVIVRGSLMGEADAGQVDEVLRIVQHDPSARTETVGETFVIDSPVLPDELAALPALIEQAAFPAPSGLLATHGDWDHLLGRLAFPGTALGVAASTAERLTASPGQTQRELRAFDEELMIERSLPLALGSVQALPVPGRCDLGDHEIELHPATGHTADGMAILLGWAGVLIAGDYLSGVEIPSLGGGGIDAYVNTLERLRLLISRVQHVVPGHGPIHDPERALSVLEEDLAYLRALAILGAEAGLPAGRRSAAQRRAHGANVEALLSA